MRTLDHQPFSTSDDEEYTVIPVIPMEDPLVHPAARPFCTDPKCPCHEEQAFILPVYEQYQEGLLTKQEATNIVNGKTV